MIKDAFEGIPIRKIASDTHTRLTHHANELYQTIHTISQLLEDAFQDKLTTLYNFAAYESFMAHLLTLPIDMLSRLKLVIFFVDLNRFKSLNTKLGHPGGDAALVRVDSLLREICVSEELPFRIGGDEFIIVTKKERVKPLIQSFESKFKYIEIVHQGQAANFSGSAGYGVWNHDSSIDFKEVKKRAEIACKRAKMSEDADGKVLSWRKNMQQEEWKDFRDRCIQCNSTVSLQVSVSQFSKGLSVCPNCNTPFPTKDNQEPS